MKSRRFARFGLFLSVLGVAALLLSASVGSAAGVDNQKIRWDIISLDFATLTISEGGHASARNTNSNPDATKNNAKITVTGHGTFRSNPGKAQAVTGGGTWETFDSAGVSTGSGDYEVTRFVSFVLDPGAFVPSPPVTDTISNASDARGGLAVLQIAYDDGSEGILVISCHLPAGADDSIFEGVTASKGVTDYWNAEPATAGVNANRTHFNVVR